MATVPILWVVSNVIVPLDLMVMESMIVLISMNVIPKLMTAHPFKIAKILRFEFYIELLPVLYFRDHIFAHVLMVSLKMGHFVRISMNVKMEVQIAMNMLTV